MEYVVLNVIWKLDQISVRFLTKPMFVPEGYNALNVKDWSTIMAQFQ